MKDNFSRLFRYFIFLMLSLGMHANAAPTESSVRLVGHIPNKALSNAVLLNSLDAEAQVPVMFVLPLRNQKELEQLIKSIHDPSDKQHYGKYLTSKEFIARFAPTQEDYDKVIAYAKKVGLNVKGTHPNRLIVNAVSSAKSIEKAFNIQLHQYQLPNGRKFHAPNNNPEVPVSIASVISGVVGLDNHAKWHPFYRVKETTQIFESAISSQSSHSFPSGPNGGFAPNDLRLAYNLSSVPSDGTGQIIALFELAAYQASDINTYTSQFGLPAANLRNVLVDGGSGGGIDAEVTLDIELALALAPKSQIYVYEGPNTDQGVLDTYNRIASDNIAKQVSTSWGLGEDLVSTQFLLAENAIFQQMAVQGQTIYAAAGDSGAYDDYEVNSSEKLVVDDPASQPYVVGVGGTRLTVNSQNCVYVSESVWNNGLGNGAGGGGVSTVWPIPTWQTSVTTTSSKTNRNVPDVALNADTNSGYAIYFDGQWQIYGGTSCAAPLWAAFTALINQHLVANQKPVLGFANPKLYTIAEGSSYSTNYHDVQSGNNLHYNATPGYDNASGWGSFNGVNLYASLTSSTTPTPPPVLTPNLKIALTNNPLLRGRICAYKINLSNIGNGPTVGKIKVNVALPSSLQYFTYSGSGWIYDKKTNTFSQSNILNPGSSYPTLFYYVSVSRQAPSIVTTTATVTGGGSSSSTSTDTTSVR